MKIKISVKGSKSGKRGAEETLGVDRQNDYKVNRYFLPKASSTRLYQK